MLAELPFDRIDVPDSSANPDGSGVSAVIVYGGVPPPGDRLNVTPNPCCTGPRLGPAPNEIGVAVGPAIEKFTTNAVVVLPASSVTWIVTFELPVFVGVPLTTPDVESSVSPGTIGVMADQV